MPAASPNICSDRRRHRGRMVALVVLLVAVGAGLVLALLPGSGTDWPALKERIRERFPGVAQLSTEELARWLADEERRPPILIDARQPEEYAVSHLPGAVNAPGVEGAVTLLAEAPEDQPVVVYCSVGWRSSALAEKLRERGFDGVSNLEGSIFEWANEGRALMRDGEPVEVVHPFDEEWGRLLERERWSFGQRER